LWIDKKTKNKYTYLKKNAVYPTKVAVGWVRRRRRIVFTTHKGMSLHSIHSFLT